MMNSLKIYAMILLCVVVFYHGHAQPGKMKFGKVDEKDIKMKSYDKDTSASAVVLADVGQSYFQFDQQNGFQVVFDRHVRIKIFDKSGYEWANSEIETYHTTKNKEDVVTLKGYTYNLKGGKVIKSKLEKDHIFEEEVSDNRAKVKFTMPDVKEGSVIEYTYKIKSDVITFLRTWEFQKSIPVIWSEYEIKVPEYFHYLTIASGYEPFLINEHSRENGTLTINTKSRTGWNVVKTNFNSSNVNYLINVYHWAAQGLPALKAEKFITTTEDYLLKMEFQLASTHFPGEVSENILGTWEEIDKTLLEHSEFGRQITKSNFFKEKLTGITAGAPGPEEKMIEIYQYVVNNFNWNGKTRLFAEESIKKVFEKGEGSSAELNLLLTAMLKEAGLDADPVIMSTRSNGKVHLTYPIISKFNNVIVNVEIDGKSYLLDGTEPLTGYNVLPPNCLNRRGRLIAKTNSRWVDIKPIERLTQFTTANYQIGPDGLLSGDVKISNGGYSAYISRKSLKKEGEEKYLEDKMTALTGWEIENFEIENAGEIDNPFKETFHFTCNNSTAMGNMMYLNPMILNQITENPFLSEERKFPVDLAAPIDETYVSSFTLPEGYQVEEMPKPALVSLPDNSARFQYYIQANGNAVQVMSKLSISKDLFLPEEYHQLREFYNLIVAKQSEQLVLKKVN